MKSSWCRSASGQMTEPGNHQGDGACRGNRRSVLRHAPRPTVTGLAAAQDLCATNLILCKSASQGPKANVDKESL